MPVGCVLESTTLASRPKNAGGCAAHLNSLAHPLKDGSSDFCVGRIAYSAMRCWRFSPPPSRGRLGGGWGIHRAPHPHPGPPLEGEGTHVCSAENGNAAMRGDSHESLKDLKDKLCAPPTHPPIVQETDK